jgi:putative hydrolase of the HAD superfamily
MEIKLILFDFGGVIASEGFQMGILKLAWKFKLPYRDMYKIAGYKAGLESGYKAGKIKEKDYWKIVAMELGVEEDLSRYNYVFLDNFTPRTAMIELVRKLRADYKVGIFSDQTNWIYDIDKKYDFFKYFDYKFISYKLGYTKHDDEFYRIPSKETGIKPEKILIVDDNPRVIDKAAEFGLNSYEFTSIKACKEYLSRLKNI